MLLPHVSQPPPLPRVPGPGQVAVLRVGRDSQHLITITKYTSTTTRTEDHDLKGADHDLSDLDRTDQ